MLEFVSFYLYNCYGNKLQISYWTSRRLVLKSLDYISLSPNFLVCVYTSGIKISSYTYYLWTTWLKMTISLRPHTVLLSE